MSTHVVIVSGANAEHHATPGERYAEYAEMLKRHLGQYQAPSTRGTHSSPFDIEVVETTEEALKKLSVYTGRPRFLVYISNDFAELADAMAKEYKGRFRVVVLTSAVPAGEVIYIPKQALDYGYLGKIFITTT